MGQASGGMTKISDRFCLCMLDENYKETEDSKWIYCEGCSTWSHQYCALVSDIEYEEIIRNKEKWYCSSYTCQEQGMKNIQQ